MLRAVGEAHPLIVVIPDTACETAIYGQVGAGGTSPQAGLAQIIEKDVGPVSSRAIGDTDALAIAQIVIRAATAAYHR